MLGRVAGNRGPSGGGTRGYARAELPPEGARRDFDARSVGRASGAKRRFAPQWVQAAAVPSGPGAASIQ